MAKSRRAGEWLIKEGDTSEIDVYKLLRGKVSVYEGGRKRTSIEVKEGEEPELIGVIAAFSSDRGRSASVVTETEIIYETISIGHIKNIIKKDLPQDIKEDIDSVIKAIVARDKINRLLNDVSQLSLPGKLKIPENISQDAVEVLSELKNIYERSQTLRVDF
jgi:hypothetical protein